jgi:hypothetical protein
MEHFRLWLVVHFFTHRSRSKNSTTGRTLKAESSSLVLVGKGGRGETGQLCTSARILLTQYVPLAAVGGAVLMNNYIKGSV